MYLKPTLIAAASFYGVIMTHAVAAETLTVVIDSVAESKGTLMVQIMASEAEFKGDSAAFASIMQRAQAGEVTLSTSNLPAGEYAIRVMHDVNGNGELDANFVGMPAEPWAMSNNAKGRFGPPKWKDVKFELKGSVTQTLKLN